MEARGFCPSQCSLLSGIDSVEAFLVFLCIFSCYFLSIIVKCLEKRGVSS